MVRSLFLDMFAQSPLKPLQEHMAVVAKAATLLDPFFLDALGGNWDDAEVHYKAIVDREHEADKLKKHIRLHVPTTLFLPISRSDLLELLTTQDRVANKAKDIAGLIFGRRQIFPNSLDILAYVRCSIETASQALKAIDELDSLLEAGFQGKEVDQVEKMIQELDESEKKSDYLQITLRRQLQAQERELPPVDVMFMYSIIESIGDLADRAQNVGHRLQLILAR